MQSLQHCWKLYCGHINRCHLWYYYIYLYAPITCTLDECHAWFHLCGLRRTVGRGSESCWRHWASFCIIRSFPVLHSSAKPVQMKSCMKFIESNTCIEIDIIFLKIGRLIWPQYSFNVFNFYRSIWRPENRHKSRLKRMNHLLNKN